MMKHYVFIRKFHKSAHWGGCENRVCRYFKDADYSRNRITLMATHDIFTREFSKRGIPVEVASFPLSSENSFIKNFRHMFKLLKVLKPDRVVFVQGSFLDFRLPEFLAGFFITKGHVFSLEVLGAREPSLKTSKRYFKCFSGLALWWYKEMFFLALRGWISKLTLAVGEEVRDRMVNWYHYPKGRVLTVATAIDVETFSRGDEIRHKTRQKYNIPEKDTVIISTARLSGEKCVDRLINAFDQLWMENSRCWLLLVGDGPLRPDLEKLASEKVSFDRIKFLGFKENVADYLRMSDLYVLSSDIEGIATAALEAMASELVCVATKTPGPSEIIQDGVNGYLVEKNRAGVLNGLTKAVALSDKQRNEMASNARKFVLEKHTVIPYRNNAVELLGLGDPRK
ncbi:MAG: glycosyltransferase [Candidatus Omnitrophica bacterium]|nr:glycosyltransferase [Candidatus Omnitrophota bacterium]